MGYNFSAIEKKWQDFWAANRTFAALDPAQAGKMPKAYVLDMFPYPSGSGLHVGHPEGYTATDIVARYLRMKGRNVLHPMGWDAFGLPAEQFAVQNNTHPRDTTRKNIANFRRQIEMLGLSYDWDRQVDTTDPSYYRWTQWIFLQLFNSYFDPNEQKARPIEHLQNELFNGRMLVAPDGSVVANPVQEGMEPILGKPQLERNWADLDEAEQRDVIDGQRLAYMDEQPVNWCPELGTVLANEEVIDGRSERGGYPVERRPLRQWMLRITAYAERLLSDLDGLNWSESLKEMQRNWIGKSIGAEVDFDISRDGLPKQAWADGPAAAVAADGRLSDAPDREDLQIDDEPGITVFTTRPDTLYGATYMVLAPEHPLVRRITTEEQRSAVAQYIAAAASRSERDRVAETREKTGVFTGAHAINPMNDEKIPVYIADYVLMGYGTGAIMAVPAHDQRDWEFARTFGLPIRAVVRPNDDWLREEWSAMKHANGVAKQADIAAIRSAYTQHPETFPRAFTGEGIAINSPVIDGEPTAKAIDQITRIIDAEGIGFRSVKYKLRDWLFSRQRYWGEPFPIVLDAMGRAEAIPESELPLVLPDLADFKPTGTPDAPLSKARDWVDVTIDGRPMARETNTMPQWAGSCWYYLRYIDPKNDKQFVDPEKERYWMPVDLYVGGVEHAVLHLLYARFWHKVLFDLGHVSTAEPFARLVNQGLILGETEYHAFENEAGQPVSVTAVRDIAEEAGPHGVRLMAIEKLTGNPVTGRRIPESDVEKSGESFVLKSDPTIRVDARSFKMSKSRGNVVSPDQIVREYGADAFRLYEMYMGPLEAQKPWNTRDIVGMARFLSSVWRHFIGDIEGGAPARYHFEAIPEALDRQMHRAIRKVGQDIEAMRFNTAIAELIKLNNELSGLEVIPRELATNFTLMLAPFAPHIAEEIWRHLGHEASLAREPWPEFIAARLVEEQIELPVQVNGKLRGKITVAADAAETDVLRAAESADSIRPWLAGKEVVRRLYVGQKLVNFVVR